jgi:NADPH:quinone reductase
MRAIQVTKFGGPEVLVPTDLPNPVAAPGHVVVEVSAADVLFLDTQLRTGWSADLFGLKPPYIPGNGVAGQVLSTGQGVDKSWTGRRVVTRTGEFGGRDGYAEQVAVPVDRLIPVPGTLDLHKAVALLNDGATALALIDNANIKPSEWVLILGAAGGLGTLLVQLAKAASARVIAAASTNQKLTLTRDLGAEVAVNYTDQNWPDQVREATGTAGVTLVLDGVGGPLGQSAFDLTARGGRFSAHGAPSGSFTPLDPTEAKLREIAIQGIEQVQFTPEDASNLTARALSEAAADRLTPTIAQTYPLTQATEAHRAIESRKTLGKTLLLL